MWLRGLIQLRLDDPLTLAYQFTSTYHGRLPVEGCLIGGDGSGGKNSRGAWTRKCGFGIAIIKPISNSEDDDYQYLGHAFGEVPGKQTVPRSEATAVLHVLRTTSGNATYVRDSWGTCLNYQNGSSYSPKSQGQG